MSDTASTPLNPSQAGQAANAGRGERLVAAGHTRGGGVRPPGWRRRVRGGHRLVLLAVAVVFTAGALGFGWRSGIARDTGESTPGAGSADAGFLHDMIVHHDQAVAMAFLMRDRSTDNLLDAIATDIIINQLIQIGMMRGYLSVWDLPSISAEPAMAWMGHPVPAGTPMPGMASAEEMQQLRTLPVPEAEVLFYRLMIRHHASGIEMAQAGISRVETRPARELAETIIPVQFNEIQLMQQELTVRGQDPEPVPDAAGMGTHQMHEMGTQPGDS